MAWSLTQLVTAVYILMPFVVAQAPDLPDCAKPCAATAANAAGCTLNDVQCLCKSNSFISATLQCASHVCPIEDLSITGGRLQAMCVALPTTSSTSSSQSATSSHSTTSTTVHPSPPITTSQTSSGSVIVVTTTVTDGASSTVSPSPTALSVVPTTSGTTLSLPATSATGTSTTIVFSTVTPPGPTGINAAEHAVDSMPGIAWLGAVVLGLLEL